MGKVILPGPIELVDNNSEDVSIQLSYDDTIKAAVWKLNKPSPGRLNEGQTEVILGLEENFVHNVNISREYYSLGGQYINSESLKVGHLYLCKVMLPGRTQWKKVVLVD